MSEIIDKHKDEFEGVIQFLNKEISSLRTGRANAAMLDGITVEAYGTKNPLVQVASISVPDSRSIIIEPWDKSIIKDVEQAIRESGLGISPVNEGSIIRLNIPQLTEESRKQLVKTLHEKLEKSRISLRGIRDKIKDEILKAEKSKEITEDDRFNLLKELDEMVSAYNKKIEEIGENKEKEIMTI